MKNIPAKIYLQAGEPFEYLDFNEVSAHGNTTWCEDKINDTDIEYLRRGVIGQDEIERILREFASVNYNRIARCRTTTGAIKSQRKTAKEYASIIAQWVNRNL